MVSQLKIFLLKTLHLKDLINSYKETGSLKTKKVPGRKNSISDRDDRALIRLFNRSANSQQLVEKWKKRGVRTSARTVRRRLIQNGLASRRATKKPFLSRKNVMDRINFCKKYKDWSSEQWGNVIFSDEAPFRLFGASGKRLV